MKTDLISNFFKDYWKAKQRPKMLLHACCAPCSSEVIARLSLLFDLTLYFYNPNIYPEEEFIKRFNQFEKLKTDIKIYKHPYNYKEYEAMIKGLEDLPEGSKKCTNCFYGRLLVVAKIAKEHGYDCFCSTLSISPHKSSKQINEAGLMVEKDVGIKYVESDFKKQNGYLNSILRSKALGLYRQVYCGCKQSFLHSQIKKSQN